MKITDLRVWVVRPEPRGRSFVFLRIDTDAGVSGIGEATSSGGGGSLIVGSMARFLRDSQVAHDFRQSLIGQDPEYIERNWHHLYRRFTGGGGFGGFVTTLLSGIDIALWDLKGKAQGKPIFRLGGGPIWESVPLYTHVAPGDPQKAAEQARAIVAMGYNTLKTDPFMPEMGAHHRRYLRGEISAAGTALGLDTVAAIREAVGPQIEILIDAHGNFNVPTAIRLGKALEPYSIGWFEEPVQPNSNQALRAVRDAVNVPLCVGERLYSRWDFVPILTGRLAQYVMPDVLWCGGITELRKIANLAEAFYVPISPHDASGPVNILAGAHVMMTVPNLYKLEVADAVPDFYNKFIDQPLDIREGQIHLSERPGLGADLNEEFLDAHPDPDWDPRAG